MIFCKQLSPWNKEAVSKSTTYGPHIDNGFQTFYIWYYSLKPLEENGKSNMFFQTGNLAQNLVSYFQRREQRDFSHKLVN